MPPVINAANLFPDSATLINLEKDTLKCIAHSQILLKFAPEFAQKAGTDFRTINPKRGFQWHLHFDARYTSGKRTATYTIYIGSKITVHPSGAYDLVSYSVTICDEKGDLKRIVRKFHFDCEPNPGKNEPKPYLHIQYCGELAPFLTAKGYSDQHIEHFIPSLEKPRFPSQPVSLGILLDWIFHEFWEEPDLQRLTKDAAWRAHIKNIEATLLYPYFSRCCDATNPSRQTTDNLFMSQLIYRQ